MDNFLTTVAIQEHFTHGVEGGRVLLAYIFNNEHFVNDSLAS